MSHPRPPLYAPNGVVATSQPLAAAAGLAALRNGGSAVDAALAAAITLTVVQPGSNDIGGDLFALVWDGGRLHGLNGSGRSPAALDRAAVLAATGGQGADPVEAFGGAQAGGPAMPAHGWLPVTVPGAPAGWHDLHERFGRLPFAELFADAIGYAEHGYPVSPQVSRVWNRAVATHAGLTGPEFAEWSRVFTVDGVRAPRAGERWRNPGAAQALRRIAASGADDFYRGRIAAALDAYSARTGGLLTGDDLAAHRSAWVEPIRVGYRDHEVWELPPNGQGVAALLALAILDGVDPADLAPEEWLHWQIEAVKLGFADAHAYVTDPDLMRVSPADLLDPAYVAGRRARIGDRAGLPVPGEPARGGTVYLCAADGAGMMVSLIQSTYLSFGSHVVLPGYGFGLQDRGAAFRLDPAHPDVVGPAKRPFHTIIPGFLTRGGEPVGPFGVMGAHMQPQGHLQVVSATVDRGLDPQAALGLPRWYWHTGRAVRVEPALLAAPGGADLVAGLRGRGHEVSVPPDPSVFGHGQAVWRGPGGYVAGSEPRTDGSAVGY
ncbi:gamma-glutamyltransferase family protein [Plantactinospora sp. KBS50]|uniref:gamma-glutamyltransferase family protein n=1 Tax=Plantactinospora sp. KBS50 TaxID=2024580 RepID=UPI000BAA9F13|nr:gamma-glutamyltransferase family protein [Plantactinospora sp. KBS50]ASW57032.1 gamma-glutamyltransferase [Plantactinospora sp. KBS50]